MNVFGLPVAGPAGVIHVVGQDKTLMWLMLGALCFPAGDNGPPQGRGTQQSGAMAGTGVVGGRGLPPVIIKSLLEVIYQGLLHLCFKVYEDIVLWVHEAIGCGIHLLFDIRVYERNRAHPCTCALSAGATQP